MDKIIKISESFFMKCYDILGYKWIEHSEMGDIRLSGPESTIIKEYAYNGTNQYIDNAVISLSVIGNGSSISFYGYGIVDYNIYIPTPIDYSIPATGTNQALTRKEQRAIWNGLSSMDPTDILNYIKKIDLGIQKLLNTNARILN